MAKLYGINGYASGKLGNTVLAIYNGVQVARQYQPVISNPKSALQMQQRAKGNLTGRISSFVPRTAIAGLGVNNRMRRAEFLRNILRKTNVTEVDGIYNAKIADGDVLFSKGSVQLSVSLTSVIAQEGVVSVNLTGVSTASVPAEDYAARQTRLVVMVYDLTSQDLVEVVTKIAAKPAQGSSLATVVPILRQGGFIAVVYAIPMSTADGSAISISTDMATKSDADIAAALSVNQNAIVFDYGYSLVLGQGNYVPA